MKNQRRFMTWPEMTITPIVWLGTLSFPTWLAWKFCMVTGADLCAGLLVFFVSEVALTFVVLKILRMVWPTPPGTYVVSSHSPQYFVWSLTSFLYATNLSFQYINGLLPPPFRKSFYAALGAQFGPGIVSIAGLISDPHLVTIEESAVIGFDSLILAHALTATPKDTLILKPVVVKKGAIIGAKCLIMPGVVIGENAMVKAMSLVTMDTHVGANEVWAGVPARKVGELPQLIEEAGGTLS